MLGEKYTLGIRPTFRHGRDVQAWQGLSPRHGRDVQAWQGLSPQAWQGLSPPPRDCPLRHGRDCPLTDGPLTDVGLSPAVPLRFGGDTGRRRAQSRQRSAFGRGRVRHFRSSRDPICHDVCGAYAPNRRRRGFVSRWRRSEGWSRRPRQLPGERAADPERPEARPREPGGQHARNPLAERRGAADVGAAAEYPEPRTYRLRGK